MDSNFTGKRRGGQNLKGESLKLIIIEDEEAHFLLMERAIRKEFPNASIYHYSDAGAFFEQLKEIHPSAVIVDYLIPGMNGLELLERLNQEENSIPVIMITGQGDERIAVQAMKSGAWDYLVKTADFFSLLPNSIERVVRERKLRDSLRAIERWFQDLAENTFNWIWEIDPQGRFLYSNAVVEKILGYPPGEIIGRHFHDFFPEEIRQVQESTFFESIAHGKSITAFEKQLVRRDGRQVIVETNGVPVFDALGKVIAYRGIARDITERKLTEEALRKSEQELRYLSSRLLSAQEDERKRIAREIHDSLGSSLSAIKISLLNIQRELEKKTPLGHSLDIPIAWTQNAIEEARRIMADLRPSMLDDLGLLATLEWLFRQNRAAYPRMHIETDIGLDEAGVPEDLKIVIFRIVQESLNNIAKYSEAEFVEFSLSKTPGKIRLVIEDNGKGFDLEAALNDRRCTRTGLGLSSMRERAELSGGCFEINSKLGAGTTIRVIWPCRT